MGILSKTALAALKASIKYQTNVQEKDVKKILDVFDKGYAKYLENLNKFSYSHKNYGSHFGTLYTAIEAGRLRIHSELEKMAKLIKDEDKFIRRKNAITAAYNKLINDNNKFNEQYQTFFFEELPKTCPNVDLDNLIKTFDDAYKS